MKTALVAGPRREQMTEQDRVFAKCAWRLIPFMGLLLVVNYVDRLNVGFAALTMNKDLGFSPRVFGFGAGVFFVSYALLQVPANVILERVGAKRWVFCILAAWGLLSASNALVQTPTSFYVLRFLLGVAEAGFFPGMLFYLNYWFPRGYLARFTAYFMVAIPLSFVLGGPFASFILRMDGMAGLQGWQLLFLIEGVPAFLLAFAVLKLVPDGPKNAAWLTREEKEAIATRLAAEEPRGPCDLWPALRDSRLLALGVANFAFQASTYGVGLWLPQIAQGMGFSNFATGFIVSLSFVFGAGAMIVCGRSSASRDERIWHVALPWLLAALGFVAASVVQSDVIVLLALAFGLTGIYAAFGPFFSLPSSFLRGTAAAGGIGLFNAIGNFGGFFGPTLFGVLKEGSGDYTSGMVACAFGMLLAALIVLAVGRAMAPRPVMVAPRAGSAGERRPHLRKMRLAAAVNWHRIE
jgi:ACS family tartrate transporter-like MFS transporter